MEKKTGAKMHSKDPPFHFTTQNLEMQRESFEQVEDAAGQFVQKCSTLQAYFNRKRNHPVM